MSKTHKAEHTPGPWILEGDDSQVHLHGSNMENIASFSEDDGEGGMEANANLIVAAPDLLAICLGMRDLIDRAGVKVHAEFDEALNRALAKAEGRAQ